MMRYPEDNDGNSNNSPRSLHTHSLTVQNLNPGSLILLTERTQRAIYNNASNKEDSAKYIPTVFMKGRADYISSDTRKITLVALCYKLP